MAELWVGDTDQEFVDQGRGVICSGHSGLEPTFLPTKNQDTLLHLQENRREAAPPDPLSHPFLGLSP